MDKIFYNGEIYTLDKNGTKVEAIGIKEVKIEAIGSSDDILKLKNENTELIDLKGTLEVGKYADMVVLEDNLFNINQDKIKDVKVELTMVNGKVVYNRGEI